MINSAPSICQYSINCAEREEAENTELFALGSPARFQNAALALLSAMTTEKFTQQAAASAKPGSAGPLPMESRRSSEGTSAEQILRHDHRGCVGISRHVPAFLSAPSAPQRFQSAREAMPHSNEPAAEL